MPKASHGFAASSAQPLHCAVTVWLMPYLTLSCLESEYCDISRPSQRTDFGLDHEELSTCCCTSLARSSAPLLSPALASLLQVATAQLLLFRVRLRLGVVALDVSSV